MRTIVLSLALLAMALPAGAAVRVITLDVLPTSSCNETWSEGNCELEVIGSTAMDCSPVVGSCFFTTYADGIYLVGRMTVDLRNLLGIETIEIDVLEGWDPGCIQAFAYDEGVLLDQTASTYVGGGGEMLTLNVAGSVPDQVAISSHEGAVLEIRLIGLELTPAAESSWGGLRTRY